MKSNLSINYTAVSLIILLLLLLTNCIEYKYWNSHWGRIVIYLISIVILFKSIGIITKSSEKSFRFKWEVLLITVIPYLSLISVVFYYNSSIKEENIANVLTSFIYLSYFILSQNKLRESDILISLNIFALLVFVIQVFQILNPDFAVFGIWNEERAFLRGDIAEIRNGMYRYRLETYAVTIICLFHSWSQLKKNFELKKLLHFSILIISLYLYLTRQLFVVVSVVIMISVLKAKRRIGFGIAILCLFAMVLYLNYDTILKFFVEQANDDLSSDYVRFISYTVYWGKAVQSPVTIMFGNGFPPDLSLLKDEGLTPADIGIIGEFFYFGIGWIVLFSFIMFKLYKNRKLLPEYLQMYFLFWIFELPMLFPYVYNHRERHFLWVIALYISSMYMVKKDMKWKTK